MTHPLIDAGVTCPFTPEPIAFERETALQSPRFTRCECGEITLNADGVCDTCVKLDSDEFGRFDPLGSCGRSGCFCEGAGT